MNATVPWGGGSEASTYEGSSGNPSKITSFKHLVDVIHPEREGIFHALDVSLS